MEIPSERGIFSDMSIIALDEKRRNFDLCRTHGFWLDHALWKRSAERPVALATIRFGLPAEN